MSYTTIVNNVAITNGDKGPYDNKISNPSVRYGRNSVANQFTYFRSENKFDLSNMNEKNLKDDTFEKKMAKNESIANNNTPNFEYKYLPGSVDYQSLDKMALLGAAYEGMGQMTEVYLDETNNQLKSGFGNDISADAVDLNDDKKIDIAECAAALLLEDMVGKDPVQLDRKNITGVMTNQSELNLMRYLHNKNKEVTSKLLGEIYKMFGLADAKKEFESNQNNLLKLNTIA